MDTRIFKSNAMVLQFGILSVAVVTGCPFAAALAQTESRYYGPKFESVATATRSMIGALADATLDSACLNKANFDRATAGLDPQSKATAIRMRGEGIRTLNETRAWNTCRSQREQALRLATDMSSAQTWSVQRVSAKRAAMLSDNEEVENGILVDHTTKAPVNSPPVIAVPVDSNVLREGSYDVHGAFDAELTVSVDGVVTACNVVASIGNEVADKSICRKAQLLMRYRPAFANGRLTAATTQLRIRFE